MKIRLIINAITHEVEVEERTLLADLLRDQLGLTGTHLGCDTSQCGCCTVHLDGEAVKSCTMLAVQAAGCSVLTIEGLAQAHADTRSGFESIDSSRERSSLASEEAGQALEVHPVQAAFAACHALQCGFCTPGMVMASADLLRRHPDPSDEQILEGLAGNLCRCTGYVNIVKAVKQAAAQMQTLAAARSGQ
ncbi:MAG: (2Fe-2S)-binding protein [Betaproteobacteria bacterium]|nr:(2Fe-2S)-binding protein [Betaproteobacteria bacterium]